MHELIEAIRAAPDDDEPRLVYADWVARTDPALGELIALQIRVARADAADIVLPERARVTARIRALLHEHAGRWAKAPGRDALRSLVLANLRLDHLGGDVATLLGVESLALSACRLGRAPANLATIAGAMPRLRALVLESDTIARERLEAVVEACPHVVRLALRDLRVGSSTIEALAPWSTRLRRLDLAGNRLDDRAVDTIARMAWPALVALRFPTRFLGPAAKARLAERFGDVLQR